MEMPMQSGGHDTKMEMPMQWEMPMVATQTQTQTQEMPMLATQTQTQMPGDADTGAGKPVQFEEWGMLDPYGPYGAYKGMKRPDSDTSVDHATNAETSKSDGQPVGLLDTRVNLDTKADSDTKIDLTPYGPYGAFKDAKRVQP
jgi:hypothetical protein